MAQSDTLDQLLAQTEKAVRRTMAYLEGPGATSTARIDRWGVWEIAAHLLHWHLVTAEAAQAVAKGEPPSRFTSPVDDINEEVVAKSAGMSLAQLVSGRKPTMPPATKRKEKRTRGFAFVGPRLLSSNRATVCVSPKITVDEVTPITAPARSPGR